MAKDYTITGIGGDLEFQSGGPRIVRNLDDLEVRGTAGALAKFRGAPGVGVDDFITLAQLSNGVFGSDFGTDQVTGLSTTTGTTYLTYHDHTTPTLPIGTYIFLLAAHMVGSSGNNDWGLLWQIDGTNAWECLEGFATANGEGVRMAYVFRTLGAAAAANLVTQYRKVGGNGASGIDRSLFCWFRVL